MSLESGSLLCARYAFMPNRLHYCGPDNRDRDIFGYVTQGLADEGLIESLKEFGAMYPYLKLIATENNIRDPLDARVVEAYWIGNSLLDKVKERPLYNHITAQYGKLLSLKDKGAIGKELDRQAKPYHNYHVLSVFRRVQKTSGHFKAILETMDNCRISWGKVKEIRGDKYLVSRRPLLLTPTGSGGIAFGDPVEVEVFRSFEGKGFTPNAKVGDTVSIHWNWACDTLASQQLKRLVFYTNQAIGVVNKRLGF